MDYNTCYLFNVPLCYTHIIYFSLTIIVLCSIKQILPMISAFLRYVGDLFPYLEKVYLFLVSVFNTISL